MLRTLTRPFQRLWFRLDRWSRRTPEWERRFWAEITADAAKRPKTFSAVRIFDAPQQPIEVCISSRVPKIAYPGVRAHVAQVVEDSLRAQPQREMRDWPTIIREARWSPFVEPFLHYDWAD